MKLGFLASGRGSNMQSILDACESGQLKAEPVALVSNNPDAYALERAKKAGLAVFYLSSKTHPQSELLDEAITGAFQSHNIDLLILAGYMKKIGPKLLSAYSGRIINIHPSLLPKFGGTGMYGMNVHEAVIAAGEKESGATIHLVNNEYDQGRILAQRSVVVTENDKAETLAEKVLTVEHQLYPETLIKIVAGDISL